MNKLYQSEYSSEHLASSHVYFGTQIDSELRIHIHWINSKIEIQIEIWYTFDAVFYYIVFNFSRFNVEMLIWRPPLKFNSSNSKNL